jgi:hypothetical protein
LQEAFRVLKSGGRFCCLELTPPENRWVKPLYNLYCFRVMPFIARKVLKTEVPYNYLPTWLSEGLAMFTEGPLDLTFVLTLSSADANNAFITVRSLCSPFPASTDQAILLMPKVIKSCLT